MLWPDSGQPDPILCSLTQEELPHAGLEHLDAASGTKTAATFQSAANISVRDGVRYSLGSVEKIALRPEAFEALIRLLA
jgi:hypothetical protein